ncbi:transposase [Haloarcula marismortui]|uniref:Transposase n=1 Tax=Haloarcula marismortui ATCC 33800 TaxID=662476 RepID=A0A8T8KKI7_9EURY|nr:transposase [Haloarcula sinaiiensis]QUJ74801.1 transposase [Haloarcula sinaiiensis ATCC 33800]
MHQFVDDAYLAVDEAPSLDADVPLQLLLWRLDDPEIPFWKAYVIKKARDASCRKMASLLAENYVLADQLGFNPDDPPSHTTLSRHWRYDDDMEIAVDEIALRARYAALWTGADFPQSLRDDGWGHDEVLAAELELDEKMTAIQHLVEEAVGVMSPHLSFGRDPDAPAFKLPPMAFITFFAHLALEGSYANTGQRTMEWLDLPSPVPNADTVQKYLRDVTVEDVDQMFTHATAALLRQEVETNPNDPLQEALQPPLHLAYDTTKIPWYGNEATEWTSGILPRDNTASAWVFAVLSVVGREMSYILGALPLKEPSEIGDHLKRFLRRVIGTYDLDVERVYLDSELYTEKAVTTLRNANIDYLIQAKDVGDISDLLDAAEAETSPTDDIESLAQAEDADAVDDLLEAENPEIKTIDTVSFGDFNEATKPSAFAWPIPPKEVGARNRSRKHEAFLTDMDLEANDLEQLGREFRKRWGVETSIRQAKRRFHARCKSKKPNVRAFYFMMAAVLYNISQYVDNRLEERLHIDEIEWTSEELLHAIREVDPEKVPDWGGVYDPEADAGWTNIRGA